MVIFWSYDRPQCLRINHFRVEFSLKTCSLISLYITYQQWDGIGTWNHVAWLVMIWRCKGFIEFVLPVYSGTSPRRVEIMKFWVSYFITVLCMWMVDLTVTFAIITITHCKASLSEYALVDTMLVYVLCYKININSQVRRNPYNIAVVSNIV